MATFRDIKKEFFNLSNKEQEQIFKEIYNFSKDMKQFLSTRLMNDNEEAFVDELNKATDYYTRSGIPKDMSPRKINSIINKAKKSKVSAETLKEMELIAFKAYMNFLNDFGGGPDIYEDQVYDHLNNYIQLVLNNPSNENKDDEIVEMQYFLCQNQNMCYDYIWNLFKELTGIEVESYGN